MGDPVQIEFDGVWKIFGKLPKAALKTIRSEGLDKDEAQRRFDCVVGVADASLQIRKGEIFCIMGLSGSGKSTLLRHVNRLIEPTAGRILVNGRDVAQLAPRSLRQLRSKTIGMVFQHMALWPHRTIRDNVAYGLEVRGIPRRTRHEIATQILAQVKLEGWETHYPDELSGGMQQRVGLARALAADPDILLMDEPFSALDPLIRSELQGQFLELSVQMQKTTLFVTHDLDEAIRLGHRVAIMKDGVIVQVGSPEEIITDPQGEYVEQFVQGISRLRFISAARIMNPIAGVNGTRDLKANENCARVRPEDGLRSIIDAMRSAEGPVQVHDGVQPVGLITPSSLLDSIRCYMPAR